MNKPPRRRRKRRRTRAAATGLLVATTAYVGLAYVFAPEFWYLRDGGRITAPAIMLTTTKDGIWGDPINVGLVGQRADVLGAFAAAGWNPADALTLRTSLEIGLSVVLDRPYADAPVSTLLYDGRPQDLAFQKADGTSPDRRHHVRFWSVAKPDTSLWLGAASFDRGVGVSHDTGQITHHISPDIDRERDLVMADLHAAGRVGQTTVVPGVGATASGRNGGGDAYFTDGMALIGVLEQTP